VNEKLKLGNYIDRVAPQASGYVTIILIKTLLSIFLVFLKNGLSLNIGYLPEFGHEDFMKL
jgi:hypothetical protein